MKEGQLGDPRVGSTLAGYKVGERIGRGGMGVVYRAEHLRLGRHAALKIVAPELAGDPSFRDRFAREARAAATLEHAHVVPVYDAGESDGELYLAMRLVEGGDLAAELAARGALDPARALELCGQMAGALDAAHAVGLIHRDVKPANVLLENRQAYLSDFGLAFGPASGEAPGGELVGTIHYAAPEQIQGRDLDGRADQYALAAVLHHCLSGRPPFPRVSDAAVLRAHLRDSPPRISEVRHGLPPALDDVLARGLDKVPKRRFASCAALMAAATEALEGVEALELDPPLGVSSDGDPPGVETLIELPPIKATWERRARVLLAGLDPQTRALVRVALAGRCEIREVDDEDERDDEEQVIAAAREQLPDLLLLDWSARGPGAAAIVAAVRDDPAFGDLRVLLTVDWRAAASPDVRAVGADATLERPFSPLQLQVKLRRLLEAGGL